MLKNKNVQIDMHNHLDGVYIGLTCEQWKKLSAFHNYYLFFLRKPEGNL